MKELFDSKGVDTLRLRTTGVDLFVHWRVKLEHVAAVGNPAGLQWSS